MDIEPNIAAQLAEIRGTLARLGDRVGAIEARLAANLVSGLDSEDLNDLAKIDAAIERLRQLDFAGTSGGTTNDGR